MFHGVILTSYKQLMLITYLHNKREKESNQWLQSLTASLGQKGVRQP